MLHHRKLLINDRIKALIYLFVMMVITILLVFLGVEGLKQLPSLNSDQDIYLKSIQFPSFFKFLVVLVWGVTSLLCAYIYLIYQYSGFLHRLSDYCRKAAGDLDCGNFHFRTKDRSHVIQASFENLMNLYHSRVKDLDNQLKTLRQKVNSR